MPETKTLRIGTAGWTIPSHVKNQFPELGSHLERYSQIFNCVEINSSFYRDHKADTYARWSDSTRNDFLFSVKLSRYFTQETRLAEAGDKLKETLLGISQLKEKWGVLLVQLPPSLDFNEKTAGRFLQDLRHFFQGTILWEPRHTSWSEKKAIDLLTSFHISKVLADPEPCLVSKEWRPPIEVDRYFRLHGTPNIYKSRYSKNVIGRLADRLTHPASPAKSSWVIFDNTTYGFATENALELKKLVDLDLENEATL